MVRKSLVGLALSLLASAPALAFDLNEQLLGLSEVPFKVGQVVSGSDLTTHHCPVSENGLVVCPIVKNSERGFGVILEKAENQSRITSVFSYWKCDPAKCAGELEKTVAALTKRLGAKPGVLDGTPIWRDREKHQRDLMVEMLGSDMVSILLIESK